MILLAILGVIIPVLLLILSSRHVFDWFCSLIVSRSKDYRYRHRPKRLILIRHGESEGNQNSTIYSTVPDHAIGLTERGREQSRLCGKKLTKVIGDKETLMFFVSPFRRSKETCELISQAFADEKILKVREDPRIREQEWGNFQDLTKRDTVVAERQKIGRFFYRFKDGESGADVYDRVSSFMDSLFREMENCLMPDNNICIVSHGLFMRLFLMRFYRWSVEKFHTLENFDNCGYCILERDDVDGSFVLTTDLETYPEDKPKTPLLASFSQSSFESEAHPTIHSEKIGQSGKKNE